MHNPLAAPAMLPLVLPVSDAEEPQYGAGRAVPRVEQQHYGKGSGLDGEQGGSHMWKNHVEQPHIEDAVCFITTVRTSPVKPLLLLQKLLSSSHPPHFV